MIDSAVLSRHQLLFVLLHVFADIDAPALLQIDELDMHPQIKVTQVAMLRACDCFLQVVGTDLLKRYLEQLIERQRHNAATN